MTTFSAQTTGEQARATWLLAVEVLKNSGMTDIQARRFFGRLLSSNKLTADKLKQAVDACSLSGTLDPAAYLTRVAARLSSQSPAMLASWT